MTEGGELRIMKSETDRKDVVDIEMISGWRGIAERLLLYPNNLVVQTRIKSNRWI